MTCMRDTPFGRNHLQATVSCTSGASKTGALLIPALRLCSALSLAVALLPAAAGSGPGCCALERLTKLDAKARETLVIHDEMLEENIASKELRPVQIRYSSLYIHLY